MPSLPPSDAGLDARLRLIVSSYRQLTGKPLIADAPADMTALRDAMWHVPRAIVAHGTEDDPIFFYGNRLALQLFEMSFEEFARLPSRLSAEPLAQEARVKLLEKVSLQGYVDGYSGMRIAKSGRRFMIADTTVWNLVDEQGNHQGQAAVFVAQG
ncbi:MEKHLA domain-containing protein [Sideroxydans lithotrophicus]|uniref:MEKHLA domain protein n=1 Tax=Sideroxydans lithotrophicus (strain ES-1) TaxID=580332 RepID=D5CPS3_SIDLE|nr:MEKHLA domain-containing protein [Sideroxydans lithotrophicus]ADE13068.1 MEKHLA domain protein [Sideroxydans lithotrophicus ES-1]